MPHNNDHRKYMEIKDLQKLRVLDSEISVTEKMQLLFEANSKLETANLELIEAEKKLDDTFNSDVISLDILSLSQTILMAAVEGLELAVSHYEAIKVSEQDSRIKHHRNQRQFDQINQLYKTANGKHNRKIEEKRMLDIGVLFTANSKEEYYEN